MFKVKQVFVAVAAVTAFCVSAPASADALILPFTSMYQGERENTLNKNTFGAGVTVNTVYYNWVITGGTFRNALSRQSTWLATGYRARALSVLEFGADFGIVSGFGKNRPGTLDGIMPTVMPMVGIKTAKGFGIEAVAMPPVTPTTTWQVMFRMTAPL